MDTIKIGLCDDRKEDQNRIVEEIQKVIKQLTKGVEPEIRIFTDGFGLVSSNLTEAFHLVFLDIEMPGCDGFETARRLSIAESHPELVFVSNHENLVFDSQGYRPLWFVRKRLLENDVKRAMIKYLDLVPERKLTLKVKTRMGYWEMRPAEIIYMECREHEIIIVMKNKTECRLWGSLKKMEAELSSGQFLRIHKNFLVNQAYIADIGKREAVLFGGTKLPIGKDRRKEVKDAMLCYERRKHGTSL